jgi:hypothetical protein
MKLVGKDFDGAALLRKLEARLKERGLAPSHLPEAAPAPLAERVDPVAFNLEMLEEHADATRPLPLETHRSGLGRAVLLAKWTFRKTCQVLINEAFGRQRLFNGHVRDSYAQLTAEVARLREELETVKAQQAPKPARTPASKPRRTKLEK